MWFVNFALSKQEGERWRAEVKTSEMNLCLKRAKGELCERRLESTLLIFKTFQDWLPLHTGKLNIHIHSGE